MIEDTTTPFDSIDRRKFLRAGVGVAGATAALPIFTGAAAAHFPAKLTIDIKPKSEKNRIVLGSGGTVTVAVIQTDGFDPTSKPVHYRFGAPDVVANGGGARPAGSAQLKDVNGDGKMDLILEFPLAETGFNGDEKKAKLLWERHKGAEHGYSGTGPVTVIGGKQPAATANTTTGHEHGTESTATTNATTGGAHGGHEHGGHEHGGEPTATMNATTAPTANTATGTAAKPATTTGKSTATTAAPATATGDSNTAAGESNTTTKTKSNTTKTTTTTAQGPGFGALAALGSVASIGAYLFARNSDNE